MSVQQGPHPSESCLLVPVPEAEPVVGRLGGRLDRAAAWGVPAHVTILYPFVLPEAITPLTTALHAAFPQYPPFGRIYPDVVPHLTIGARPPGGPATLEAAEAEVWPALPVRTFVSRAWLMTGTQAAASWRVAAEFPLGA